ncbi:hypothetical protein [Microtetraspora malaysiensis]|uniref:hypothetical protein n=1 Tax=Microtetraspora malaysiensis TaxID=161358 RepID=UPI000A5F108A|nr:hypothetical protein [Microtetraspora malaysiensis]
MSSSLIASGTELSLAAARPALLLIPAAGGFHQDHQAVHAACFAAARAGGEAKPTPRFVLGYMGPEEVVWNAAAAAPTVYVDTTAHCPAKEAALAAHASQLREGTHPRSIPAIHAIDSATGAALAERFIPYRLAY